MFEKDYNQVNINNAFIDAVMRADLATVKEMFEQENTPTVDYEINGVPVIMYAAQHGDWAMVEELYNLGADLDAKVQYLQWHLIHECIKTAPEKVTKALLDYCNINAQTKDGKTPLMVAIKENKISMADYLIDLGRMDLSLLDKDSNNVAHYAAMNSQYDLFIKIAQAGAPLNKENKDGKTPIDLIEDVSFKENLPKILGELAKIDKMKKSRSVEESNQEENEVQAEQTATEKNEVKPKVSGLSSIKRKQ